MIITRTSVLTGKTRSLEIPVTVEQMQAFEAGALIQRVMPEITADQREFILNGITADEWSAYIGDDDYGLSVDGEPAF